MRASARGRPARTSWTTTCWRSSTVTPPAPPWNRRVAARQSGVIEVQSHDLLLQAILWGACIGLLPHYAGRLERNLAALPQVFDEPMRREVWMSVQPEAENRVEVRALLDLIEHAFDDRRDWFGR
ncbi:TPA: LysR substrate-binding domain-containing protein [Pseudomonas aeruginosa]